jgi:hypothetical protein
MWGLNVAMAKFTLVGLGGALASIPKFIGMMYQLFYSTQLAAAGFTNLARAIALTGIGAIAVGAGYLAFEAMNSVSGPPSGSSPGNYGGYGGGGGGGATINIYGDVGNSEYQKMQDNFGSMYDEKSDLDENMEK